MAMKFAKWVCLFLAAALCGVSLLAFAACGPAKETGDGTSAELSGEYRQLTKEELALDTRSLAELVLQSPYVTKPPADILAQEGRAFEWACENFNGLQELMERADAGNVLARIYNDAVEILAQNRDYDAYEAGIWSQSLLSQPIFAEKRTVELTDFNWTSIIMHPLTDETGNETIAEDRPATNGVPTSGSNDESFASTSTGEITIEQIDDEPPAGRLTAKELALDTRELTELILQKYCVTAHLYKGYSDPQAYYQWLHEEFNGVRELETREDAGSTLVDFLCDSVNALDKDDSALDGKDHTLFIYNSTFLLMQPAFSEKLTSEERERESCALQQLEGIRQREAADDPVLSDHDCQLTEEELALDTRSLAKLVIQSEYIQGYLFSSTPSLAADHFGWACESFNGLRELIAREDAADVLAQIYNDAAAHFIRSGNIGSYGDAMWSSYLLSQSVIRKNLTVDFPVIWGLGR